MVKTSGTKRKKSTKSTSATKKKKTESKPSESSKFDVVIEACKSWGAFKSRASKLEKLVKAGNKSVKIETNPKSIYPCVRGDPSTRPRKGTFEVRIGEKKVISLVGMPRPFKKLKALDIEDLSKKVLAEL